MSDSVRMEITFSDDPTAEEEPLFTRLKKTEEAIAEKEGRKPKGWYWIEGMDAPAPVWPEEEEEPHE